MLTLEQIQQYYSSAETPSKRNLLMEYIQHELLDSIFKQKPASLLSFMGGTSLRIVYGGNRFSEDLDFDNFGLSFKEFEELFNTVIEDMNTKGFRTEFRFVEKGAYHCYVKFPHILQKEKISSVPNEKILVRVDTVQKKEDFKPIVRTLNKFDVYRDIIVNPIDIILSQKLVTILRRKREKGRDFHDVSFLYGKTEPNYEYLEKITRMKEGAFFQELVKRCEQLDYVWLARDVEPFLIDRQQSRRILGFLDFIKEKAAENKNK